MTTEEPLEVFQRTPYNASLVLGMCLKSFSGQTKLPKSSSFDLAEMCQKWGWSESVMDALASLATSRCVAGVAQVLVSWLTSFKFWVLRPIAVGDNLPKSEGISPIPLTVITVKRFAYLFLPSGNENSRRKGGHQEVPAMRERLDRRSGFPGACTMDWEVTSGCSRWTVCCL